VGAEKERSWGNNVKVGGSNGEHYSNMGYHGEVRRSPIPIYIICVCELRENGEQFETWKPKVARTSRNPSSFGLS
jgi:hypothetical protein